MPAGIVIVANLWVREGQLDRVVELLSGMARYTHANEPGAERFALHRDTEDPSHLVMIEAFADQAALDAHRASDPYRELMASLSGGVLRDRDRVVLEPMGVGDPVKGHVV